MASILLAAAAASPEPLPITAATPEPLPAAAAGAAACGDGGFHGGCRTTEPSRGPAAGFTAAAPAAAVAVAPAPAAAVVAVSVVQRRIASRRRAVTGRLPAYMT